MFIPQIFIILIFIRYTMDMYVFTKSIFVFECRWS